MSSRKKKKKNNNRIFISVFLIIVSIGILIFIALAVMKIAGKKDGESQMDDQIETPDTIGTVTASSETEEKEIFPYELEGGKLIVESLFQYSGFNPDCGDEEGENIASLSIKNQSEEFLVSARITATLTDDTEIAFEVKDVPAGQSLMVFSFENISYEMSNKCKLITCTAEFAEGSANMEDKISVEVQETTVILTNLTDEELTNLNVYCHCLLDDAYFGGLTYSYPVEVIEAGGSFTLQAEECYLGEAEVVRIQENN